MTLFHGGKILFFGERKYCNGGKCRKKGINDIKWQTVSSCSITSFQNLLFWRFFSNFFFLGCGTHKGSPKHLFLILCLVSLEEFFLYHLWQFLAQIFTHCDYQTSVSYLVMVVQVEVNQVIERKKLISFCFFTFFFTVSTI